MWYCSLDMASGFWVVEMTERAREISAFITPPGLFEWLRMPFGLKNAPQICQRLIDNALCGYLKIGTRSTTITSGSPDLIDVFTDGEPDSDMKTSALGRSSYIDDTATQGCRRGDQSQDRHEEANPEVKMADAKDIGRDISKLLQGESRCHTDGSAIRYGELQENSDRLVKRNDVGAIGEEKTRVEPLTESTYRNESGWLYAEDIDRHMAVLPEVVIPAVEMSLEDIQAGDPGEPLSSDQEKLRQLIWANRHLLIGKGNALHPAARGGGL